MSNSEQRCSSIRPTDSERTYKVDEALYIIRGLKPTEINRWAGFCASVFAYKKNPPHSSYFSRHFIADPDRQGSSWIQVALDGTQIVASCRLFFRRVSVGNKTLVGAGIGEVCTGVAHRRRGLSKLLLRDAFFIMENEANSFDFSFLHASETFFDFYRSVGYHHNAVSWWHTALIDCEVLATQACNPSLIRMANFPQDADQLMKLHQTYTEQRVRGSIVRSRDYWVDYVSEELKGKFYVLCEKQDSAGDQIVGWLSLRLHEDDSPTTKLQLKEFGCSNPERECYSVLVQLLNHAVVDLSTRVEISPRFRFHLPTLVLEDTKQKLRRRITVHGRLRSK